MEKIDKLKFREDRLHGTSSFPCAFYSACNRNLQLIVKPHWHEEIEIIYLKSGRYTSTINMESFDISQECFLFLNRGELHHLQSLDSNYEEQALVFDPNMLHFHTFDSIEERVLQPISNGNLLFPRFLNEDHPVFDDFRREYQEISSAFFLNIETKSIPEQLLTDDVLAQLQIKSSLLKMISILFSHGMMDQASSNDNHRIESIKNVILYISAHYQEKIYIQDLARLVNMNEQYFCRFFKRAIGKPPIDYLNDYRLNKVIQLLKETDLSITEIGLECGFNNMGNFQRLFHRKTGTTPLQYRKKYHRE